MFCNRKSNIFLCIKCLYKQMYTEGNCINTFPLHSYVIHPDLEVTHTWRSCYVWLSSHPATPFSFITCLYISISLQQLCLAYTVKVKLPKAVKWLRSLITYQTPKTLHSYMCTSSVIDNKKLKHPPFSQLPALPSQRLNCLTSTDHKHNVV